MSKFTDHLWRDLVQEHGPMLAHADRPQSVRAVAGGPLRRPRLLAGSTLALASVGAAFALALGAASTPPAYAITRQHDGSLLVKITRRSGIAGANRRLAAMGIHERVRAASDGQSVPLSCVVDGPGTDGKSLVVTGYPTAPTGPVSAPSSASGSTGSGDTGTGTTGAGRPAVGTTWHVVACSSVHPAGNTGSGNTGAG